MPPAAMRFHHFRGQPRRHDEGDRQRNGHAHRRIDRNRAHVRPHQPGDKRHWQQRRDDRQRRQNGRPTDFIDGGRDDLKQTFVRIKPLPAMDIFNHHDGVIDQDADRKYQREQRHAVQREAPRPGREKRCRQRQRHRHANDHCLAPAQREKHQQHDEGGRKNELADQFLRLFGRRFAIVARDGDFNPFRNHFVFQGIYPVDRSIRHIGRIDARLLRYLHRDRGKLAILVAKPGIAFRLIRTILDRCHIAHVDWLAFTGITMHRNDQLLHIRRRFKIGAGLHQHFLVAGSQVAG